jgi:hypothetical protein
MRLIDADRILQMKFDARLKPCCTKTARTMAKAFGTVINEQPTIDAKPVIHAHWKNDRFGYPICSNCGCDALCQALEEEAEETPYCPYCGAKMDEEV